MREIRTLQGEKRKTNELITKTVILVNQDGGIRINTIKAHGRALRKRNPIILPETTKKACYSQIIKLFRVA